MKLQDQSATITISVATTIKYHTHKKEVRGPSITDQTSTTSEGHARPRPLSIHIQASVLHVV
jgi:hypothetical protein